MRLRLLAAALVLPLGLACSSTDVVKLSALEIVRRAAAKTAEPGTARVTMTLSGGGVEMTMDGVTSLKTNVADTFVTMTNRDADPYNFEVRSIGDVLYFTNGGAVKGKHWLKFDLSDLSQRSGIDFDSLAQMRQNGASNTLAFLNGVSDDVTEEGKETIRDEEMTRYHATIDLTRARDAQPAQEVRDALDQILKRLGVSSFPATVWIDRAGRMRKMSYDVDLSKSEAHAMGTLHTTIEIFDFGVPVDVEPPPANDTLKGPAPRS